MTELKPCPFCGCEDIYSSIHIVDAKILCPECGARGPSEHSIEDASNAWNSRPSPWLSVEEHGYPEREGWFAVLDRTCLDGDAWPEMAQYRDKQFVSFWDESGEWYAVTGVTHYQPIDPPQITAEDISEMAQRGGDC